MISSSPGTTKLRISGMTCGNCARKVTAAMQGLDGVHSVTVNVEARQALVRWNVGTTVETAALLVAVKSAGYDATILEANPNHSISTPANWHFNLWLGGFVTATLILGEWVLGLAMQPWFQWFGFGLAGVVQLFCGAEFYSGAWRQLKAGRSNMDTLVTLGSTTAFGYSVWVLFSGYGGHVYFMEAAGIITLISIGHWLEARVSERASGALKALLHLAPPTARRIQFASVPPQKINPRDIFGFKPVVSPQTLEVEIPVSDLKIGDQVALCPGDHIPVDGVVVDGNSAVNESMLTGESAPVDKSAGQELYAGTVNLNGRLVMRVTATGEATALANIIAAVQRAQTSRANIQRLGDGVSNVFVPVVVILALAAGGWWGFTPESAMKVHAWLAPFLWTAHPPAGVAAGFIIAAAMLIVACPCAMGLATPAAIMASANAAARRGILIRDGVALEKAGNLTAVLFDKTGTLTVGKPEVAQVWKAEESTQNAETIAVSLARHSAHPVSQAIAKIPAEKVELRNWQEVRGSGVEADIEQPTSNAEHRTVKARLGSLRWLKESGADLAAGEKFIGEWVVQGATLVGLAVEKDLVTLFAVKDLVKPGAAEVMAQLQQQGLKTYLLTGDHALLAAGIARHCGIAAENVFAEVKPEQKAEFVKRLQAVGERVAFVGDGINDAPALTQADLGIAVSRASDVAREAADIILLKSEIEAVPEALALARATLRTVKQNFFWAFFYNAVGVPLAALGFMNPMLCAVAMGMSDLIVIGNALRLARWRR